MRSIATTVNHVRRDDTFVVIVSPPKHVVAVVERLSVLVYKHAFRKSIRSLVVSSSEFGSKHYVVASRVVSKQKDVLSDFYFVEMMPLVVLSLS